MLSDEVVNEVRAAREAHAAKFDYDLRKIYDDLKQSEAARIAAGHPYVALPANASPPASGEHPVRFLSGRFAGGQS